MLHRRLPVFILFSALLAPCLALADEILTYDVNVIVALDGSARVEERFVLDSTGELFETGMKRHFPRIDAAGRELGELRIVQTTIDGDRLPHRLTYTENEAILHLGGGVLAALPSGPYTFGLRYEVPGIVGRQPIADDLHWHATGFRWPFPVREATVTVELPPEVTGKVTGLRGYFGAPGERVFRIDAERTGSGARFSTVRPLEARQSLTVAMLLERDAFDLTAAPTPGAGDATIPAAEAETPFPLEGFRRVILLLSALWVAGLFVATYRRLRSLPSREGTIPNLDPPDDLSPAVAAAIWHPYFDETPLVAAWCDLQRRGKVAIHRTEGRITLELRDEDVADLPPEEAFLVRFLAFRKGQVDLTSLSLDDLTHMRDTFQERLDGVLGTRYFRVAGESLLAATLISAVVALLAIVLGLPGKWLMVGAMTALLVLSLRALVIYSPQGVVATNRLTNLLDGLIGGAEPKEKTRAECERLLPYAVALQVEAYWTRRFPDADEGLAEAMRHALDVRRSARSG